MTTAKCQHCDRPAPHATLCQHCTRTLRMALRNVAALYADMDTTVRTRATRITEPAAHVSGGRLDQPLPVDNRFTGTTSKGTTLDREVRATLSTWCRRVLTEYPPTQLRPLIACTDPHCDRCGMLRAHRPQAERDHQRRTPPTGTVTSMAVYLFRMAGAITAQQWADDLLRDMLALERQLRRFVDRPGDAWYAGLCGTILEPERPHDATTCACACHHHNPACDMPGGCGREYTTIDAVLCTRPLWAQPDDTWVRCRDCDTRWDIDDRKEILLVEAGERVATVDAIFRIVNSLIDPELKYTQLSARVRQWKHRGKIHPVGTRVIDGVTVSAYRVGDVLDLLTTTTDTAAS